MLFFNLETENDVVNEENENTKSEVVENETTSENELCEAEPLETSDVQTMSEEAVTEASPEPVEETAKIVPEETSETEFAQENINALGYVEPCDNDGAFAESTPAGTGAGEATAMAVKEIVRSKTMIVSAIAFTISVVLSVILSFLSGVSANRFAADAAGILNSLELGYEFIPVKMYGWDMSFVLSALVAAFSIFAVWNIFFIGRKKNGKTIGMSGVTVFWVYSMIGVVISGFTLILLVLCVL